MIGASKIIFENKTFKTGGMEGMANWAGWAGMGRDGPRWAASATRRGVQLSSVYAPRLRPFATLAPRRENW